MITINDVTDYRIYSTIPNDPETDSIAVLDEKLAFNQEELELKILRSLCP